MGLSTSQVSYARTSRYNAGDYTNITPGVQEQRTKTLEKKKKEGRGRQKQEQRETSEEE
jgi:hypothetical protein